MHELLKFVLCNIILIYIGREREREASRQRERGEGEGRWRDTGRQIDTDKKSLGVGAQKVQWRKDL